MLTSDLVTCQSKLKRPLSSVTGQAAELDMPNNNALYYQNFVVIVIKCFSNKVRDVFFLLRGGGGGGGGGSP